MQTDRIGKSWRRVSVANLGFAIVAMMAGAFVGDPEAIAALVMTATGSIAAAVYAWRKDRQDAA